ncbi:hypothetical protein V1512DRAFT_257313 [Lipomyces arxii]|uniref:mitochondrial 37S ribosomal protein mS38 n=1 Tax=Lipomyces arxii TaxID=56418 RepID=UPI0034CDAF25
MASNAMLKVLARSSAVSGQRSLLVSAMPLVREFSSNSRCYSSSSSSSSSSPSSKYSRSVRGRRHLRKSLKQAAEAPAADKKLDSVVREVPAMKHTSIMSLAYDIFFAGHRPIYTTKPSPINFEAEINTAPFPEYTPFSDMISSIVNEEDKTPLITIDMEALAYPLGTTSATGLLLDPVMKTLPVETLEQIRTNRPPPPPGVALSPGSGISDATLNMIRDKFSQKYDGDALSTADIFSTLKCFAMFGVDYKTVRDLQKRLDKREDTSVQMYFATVDSDGNLELVRPVSKRKRPSLHATSVVRKRKLKIKKHKLRKRRKAERALKRKLNG